MPVEIAFDRYLNHEALSQALHELAAAYPELATLTSIGRSHRGRDLWLMELTNPRTGSAAEKPGYWIDANIHAEEVSGAMVALHTIHHLLTGYGQEPRATALLDEQVFYVLPRANPDGAELSMTQPYPWCGNGRLLPEEMPLDGVNQYDIDGNGHIAQMRIPDELGEWRISELDPRLMVQREPGERGGRYYRLIPEGFLRNFDGVEIKVNRTDDGNLNRNFPTLHWLPDPLQYGAGPYPLSEPETRAIVEFIAAHPNICGAVSYHTHSGVILRPYGSKSDDHIPREDLAVFAALGRVGQRLTGYPLISVFHEFTDNQAAPRTGTFTEYAYEQLGILAFATELWDPYTAAGIKKPGFYPLRAWSEEDRARLLRWNDEELGGAGFIDWTPFDHPQLGPIEIGGWKRIWFFRNPPEQFLAAECAKNTAFTLEHAAAAPRLRLARPIAHALAPGLYRVSVVLENTGYLPTNVTEQALAMKVAPPVTVELAGIDPADVLMNERVQTIGHLSGRSERRDEFSPWGNAWGTPRKRVEWLVRAEPGRALTAIARSTRAGTARLALPIDA